MKFLILLIIFGASAFAYDQEPRPRSTIECQARGFDCYLYRKCVLDGSIRPFAKYHPRYRAILKHVQSHPTDIEKFPKIFYTCTKSVD